MSRRTGPTNAYLKQLIEMLKKNSYEVGAPLWRDVAEKLGKPRRQRVEVNLSDISKYAQDGGAVVVPGVVLGNGELTKTVSIAAWRFSSSALEKMRKAKCRPIAIEELMKINPKGTGVRILM
ncbi:MAG: 50S ribosomal protein L18e [Candidatus Aenigmarchaeota archaeon]|nr:50S ribosomal protein L18e [Candidatus Aenigmarchaeota archaeon]